MTHAMCTPISLTPSRSAMTCTQPMLRMKSPSVLWPAMRECLGLEMSSFALKTRHSKIVQKLAMRGWKMVAKIYLMIENLKIGNGLKLIGSLLPNLRLIKFKLAYFLRLRLQRKQIARMSYRSTNLLQELKIHSQVSCSLGKHAQAGLCR